MNRETFTKVLKNIFGENIQIEDIKKLSGGCINHATCITTNQGAFFAKWNAFNAEGMFEREAESLKELEKACTILRIPKVYWVGTPPEGGPACIITEYLAPGRHANQEIRLGEGLAELHQFTAQKHGFYHDNYCGATLQQNEWQADWVYFFGKQRLNALLIEIEREHGLSSRSRDLYDSLIDKLPELIGHKPTPALNHGDLWAGNFHASLEGSSLIDPAAYYADREADLAMMRMFGGFSQATWDAYQQSFPLSPEWKYRSDLYQLYHHLNHYLLFGGGYGASAERIAKFYVG